MKLPKYYATLLGIPYHQSNTFEITAHSWLEFHGSEGSGSPGVLNVQRHPLLKRMAPCHVRGRGNNIFLGLPTAEKRLREKDNKTAKIELRLASLTS